MNLEVRELLTLTKKDQLTLKQSVWLIQRKYRLVKNPKQNCIYGCNDFEPFDTESKCRYGRTALIEEARVGGPEGLQLLIEAGSDVNAICNMEQTALMWLSENKSIESKKGEMAKMLIYAGSNIDFQDNNGCNALMTATINSEHFFSKEIYRILVEAGVNLNLQGNKGDTALAKILPYNKSEVIGLLIRDGADINIQNSEGMTALMIASLYGYVKYVKYMLWVDSTDLKLKCNKGHTALIYAIKDGPIYCEYEGDWKYMRQKGIKKKIQISKMIEECYIKG